MLNTFNHETLTVNVNKLSVVWYRRTGNSGHVLDYNITLEQLLFCHFQAELWKEFKETHAPKYMTWFEKAVDENKTGFLVGSSVSCPS